MIRAIDMGTRDGVEHSVLELPGRSIYAAVTGGHGHRTIALTIGRDVVRGDDADEVTRMALAVLDAEERVYPADRHALRHEIVMALYAGSPITTMRRVGGVQQLAEV